LSAVAGLREFYESDEAQALAAPPNAAELLKLVDTVIRFTRLAQMEPSEGRWSALEAAWPWPSPAKRSP